MPYLGGLDGVRAIAVAGVVVYHLGAPWMRGGFLGVDVFFVLSGYLITTLVLDEVERTGGFSFRRFYARRARRLLPALGPAAGRDGRRRGRDAERGGGAARRHRGRRDVRVELVAGLRRPLVLRDGQPTTPAPAPVVAGHRGAVLPGVPAGRRAWRCGPGGRASGRSPGSSRCCRRWRWRSWPSAPPPPYRTTPAGCTSAPTPTPWGCWSARRWPPPGRRGAPGTGPGRGSRERGRAVRRFEAGVTDVLGVLALARGRWRRSCGSTSSATRCTAGASWRSRCWRRCSSERSRTPPGCSGARSAASRGAGSVSGPTASTCGTGPSSCSAAPGWTSTCPRGWPRSCGWPPCWASPSSPTGSSSCPSAGARWAGRSRACVGRTRTGRAPCCGSSPRPSVSWSSAGSRRPPSRRCPGWVRTPGPGSRSRCPR